MQKFSRLIFVFFLGLAGCEQAERSVNDELPAPSFEVSIDSSVASEALDGRILLMFSRTAEFDPDGIDTGSPIFGVTVDGLSAGEPVVIDVSTPGQPVESIADFPAGEYFVKAYLNVYTTFNRADGRTIKLHMDQGEGQQWYASPGNLYSEPQKISFDPASSEPISVVIDQVIPPIAEPVDTEWVRNIKIESARVSEFWGQPMHLGAKILLPKGYKDDGSEKYPLVIWHDHFSADNPGRFTVPAEGEEGNAFYKAWTSDNFPRVLLASIQHATPYYDDSYAINSANMGPYGDAINYELLPEVEKRFNAVGEPWARALTGCSTGGWIALATQVWYPDLYGGVWSFSPDQVDFNYYQLVNLYKPELNAYYQENAWSKVPLPSMRQTDGRPIFTIKQEVLREEVIGTRYRSGGQWAVWNALFAPVGSDGYPQPIWEPWTGEIDPATAQAAIDNYDIVNKLRTNWSTLGPKLDGKINVISGRMDNFYLQESAYLLEEFLAETSEPHVPGKFTHIPRGGHCRDQGARADRFYEIAEHMKALRPLTTSGE